MSSESPRPKSILEDEAALRWNILEEEAEPCAVVSRRMELLYLNAPARGLTAPDWFAKRCWEALPTQDERCAMACPAIQAVNRPDGIQYCEEIVCPGDGTPVTLGVAVVPLEDIGGQRAAALLLFRPRDEAAEESTFQSNLLADAASLLGRVAARLS